MRALKYRRTLRSAIQTDKSKSHITSASLSCWLRRHKMTLHVVHLFAITEHFGGGFVDFCFGICNKRNITAV